MEEQNIYLGIHLINNSLEAAFYKKDMKEAELIKQADIGTEGIIQEGIEEKKIIQLLESYIKAVIEIFDGNNIVHISFSFPDMDDRQAAYNLSILSRVDMKQIPYSIQTDQESFYDFAVFQNSSLWTNEVVYFSIKNNALTSMNLVYAGFPHEKGFTVKDAAFADFDLSILDEAADEAFTELLKDFFDKRLISSVFLEGDIFNNSWMNNSLKLLCRNRRVFGVNNLVVKGACYRGLRSSRQNLKATYYMGRHQLPFNINMKVNNNGKEELCRLVKAGTNWYEADFKWCFMINDVDVLNLRTDPAIDGVKRYIDIDISWIPHRPKFASKIEVSIHFAAGNKWYIRVTDLGLEELYPSDNKDTTIYMGEW